MENFKSKLTKYKIYFQNWKFKTHNRLWIMANSQLRKTQFSVTKRVGDVITQTNSDKQHGIVEDFKHFNFKRINKCS